ncbi:hypothetical protein [Providencia rettgeri]|uniref:hypothetical protein n=1 Tax=Providencia rettgeri TaxID=587 RepID=UPI003C6E65B4
MADKSRSPLVAMALGVSLWQKPVSDLVKPSGWSPMESRQRRRRPATVTHCA